LSTDRDKTDLNRAVAEIVAPLLPPLGAGLWGVEVSSSSRAQVVRVYIEALSPPDGGPRDPDDAGGVEAGDLSDQGVTIEKCAEVSRNLGVVLDVENIFPGAYTLEVSSPGLDRKFFSLEQLTGYTGRVLQVRLKEPQDGRRRFRGELSWVGEDSLGLEADGVVRELPWSEVQRAQLIGPDPLEAARKRTKKLKKGGK
jgi:ribosome maturation factor RimP